MKALLLVSICCLSFPSAAVEMLAFRPVEQVIGADETIVIRGYKGDVTLTGNTSTKLVVGGLRPKSADPYNQWNFTMKRNGKVLEIVVKGPSELEDWTKVISGDVPQFSLKISGPPRKVFLSWQHGKIRVDAWKDDVVVNSTDSSIVTTNTKGALRLQTLKGAMSVSGHVGTMNLQTRGGRVSVQEAQGPVTVSNQSATIGFTKHKGSVNLQNFAGSFSATNCDGDLVFNSSGGRIVATGHSGSIRGETGRGPVDVKAKQLQEFNVTSESGAVTLDLPKSAGAYVSIRSEKGRLRGAPHFAKIRKGRWTELKGKLKGQEQGQVKIVSKYGDIVVK